MGVGKSKLFVTSQKRQGGYSADSLTVSPSRTTPTPHPSRKGEGKKVRQVTDEICPPSTRRIEPVMNEALSLARNTAAAANSSISP